MGVTQYGGLVPIKAVQDDSDFFKAFNSPGNQNLTTDETGAQLPASELFVMKDRVIDALATSKDMKGASKFLNVDSNQLGFVANQLKQQSKLAGIDWNNKAKSAEYHYLQAAHELVSKGVTDIRKMRQKDGVWYNGSSKVDINSSKFGQSAQGEGFTKYRVQADAQGRPVFYHSWEDSSDKAKIVSGLGLVLNVLAPGAGSAIGSAVGLSGTAASLAGNAILQGGLAAAGGADMKGILRSAAGGAAGGALSIVPGFSQLPGAAKTIISGAVSGAIKSDSSKGALLGAVTGAVPGNLTGSSPAVDRLLKAVIGDAIKRKVMRP